MVLTSSTNKILLKNTFFAFIVLFFTIHSSAQTFVGPGTDWNTASNWSPSGIPSASISGTITINSNVNVASITVNNKGALIVNSPAILTVGAIGNSASTQVIDFQNGSKVTVNSGASMIVYGLLNNSNNSDDVKFDGLVSVDGNITVGNGSTVIGSGSLSSTGTVTGAGTVFGTTNDCTSENGCNYGCSTNTISANQAICSGGTVALTGNTTTGYSYQWQSSTTSSSTGFSNISGAISYNYVSSALTTTTYFRRIVSVSGCSSSNSNVIKVTVNPSLPATVSISASASSICAGMSVTFTATPTNGGTTPTYQWKLNGTNVGTNANTYTNAALSNNDLVTCVMISNATCVTGSPATSNIIKMVVNNTNNWTGATNTSWFTPANWSCGSVPTAASDVTIPNNVTKKPIVDGTSTIALANTLTADSGSSLTVNSGNTLKVTDKVTNNGGTITFEDSASLVQINDNAINTGVIKYKRNTAPIRQTDYTYWSSPVAPLAGGGYLLGSIATSQYYLSYDSSVKKDWIYENASTQMTKGVGYAIQGPSTMAGSPYSASFVGVPNNGIVTVPVIFTNPLNLLPTDPNYGVSYLLGNPYPSAINAETFLTINASLLDGTLYFWTHYTEIGLGTSNLGSGTLAFTSDDYASYNYTGGVSGTGYASPTIGSSAIAKDIPNGKIAAGQGFFATSIKSGNVIFNNSMRLAGTILANKTGINQQFFKTNNPETKTASISEKHRVWLNMSNTQGAFKQTLIGYVTDATNEYDSRFDGESFDGNEFVDFYSINQDKNLVIQGRALPFDENDEVPLGFRTTINGEFTINIDQVDGSLTNQPVFIEDKLTNTVFDLKSGNYTFNTAAGTFDDRFVLRYTNKTLSIDETAKEDGILVLYSNNYKTLIIHNNDLYSTVNSVALFNITGQSIANWEVNDFEQTNIQFPIKNISSGVYIVKVKTTKGESSKKIVVR